jgi:hypothetical protein
LQALGRFLRDLARAAELRPTDWPSPPSVASPICDRDGIDTVGYVLEGRVQRGDLVFGQIDALAEEQPVGGRRSVVIARREGLAAFDALDNRIGMRDIDDVGADRPAADVGAQVGPLASSTTTCTRSGFCAS